MQPPARLLLLPALALGCADDWCARFDLDCDYVEAGERPEVVDEDGDAYGVDDDCNDFNADIHPSAPELCNGIDDDCDGEIDDGIDAIRWYRDRDGDGYGDPADVIEYCERLSGRVQNAEDCDDSDGAIRPGADERCNDIDDDCDSVIDDEPIDGTEYYPDADGDGFASSFGRVLACDQPSDYLPPTGARDCDDSDDSIHPDATEVCDPDAVDEDCNGLADDQDTFVDPNTRSTWFYDGDGDGFGDAMVRVERCVPPGNFVADATDCNDAEVDIHPGADETCNGRDDDCDGDDDEDPATGPDWFTDGDDDGYGDDSTTVIACSQPTDTVARGGDCDDTDDRFHPGAPEADCSDPADYNCDGATGRSDTDGDGWDACEECNDADGTVNPDATEVCDGDAVDEDCDGLVDDADPSLDTSTITTWFPDRDGDGHGDAGDGGLESCGDPSTSAVSWVEADALDCDDADPAVSPSVAEVCDNGVDDDCSGDATGCALEGAVSLADATVTVTGLSGDFLGRSVASAGDIDGDGIADVLLGAPGADASATDQGVVLLMRGGGALDGARGTLSRTAADAVIAGDSAGNTLGWAAVGVGDIDGDGFDDVLLGQPGESFTGTSAGGARLLLGPLSGTLSTDDAAGTFYGVHAGDQAGKALGPAADLDGDGVSDLLIAASHYGSGERGMAYLVFGPATVTRYLSAADVQLAGQNAGDRVGVSLTSPGDLDGDGFDDLVIGAMGADGAASASGRVYVLRGPLSGDATLAEADATLEGTAGGDNAGSALAAPGDLDGDGRADLVVGAPNEDSGATDAGAAYLLLGGGAASPWQGSVSLASADATWLGAGASTIAGRALAGGQDLDGDGVSDLVIGGDPTGSGEGGAWVVDTTVRGSQTLDAATAVILGTASNGLAGRSLALLPDIDGNGRAELLIGAAGVSTGTGAAYLLAPLDP